MIDFTIGTDFEMPIINKTTGQPISGVGLIGGTKDEPLSIGNGCGRQEDNVMAEFTIPPCKTFEEFVDYISYCIEKGNEILAEINPDFVLVAKSSFDYPEDELMTEQAMRFGCMSSYDVYSRQPIENPPIEQIGNLRSAGFHIHFGRDEQLKPKDIEVIVKLFDSLVVLPSLLLDSDTERRKLYGKPGEFRFKPYGCECRALGAGMLGNLDLVEFVWEQTMKVIERFNAGKPVNVVTQALVKEAIDSHNLELAEELCEKLEIKIPEKCKIAV